MRLLIATDGSDGAARAIDAVGASFRPDDVEEIAVVSVVAPKDERRPDAADHHRLGLGHANLVAELARDTLIEAGFLARAEVLEGHPAERIVDRATNDGVDLVVVGAGDPGRLGGLIGGGVASKVARYAPLPVLLVASANRIGRIVVGADGSAAAAAALDCAARLPLRPPLAVLVATAYEVPGPLPLTATPEIAGAMTEATLADRVADLDQARDRAARLAAAGAERLTALGLAATPEAIPGSSAEALARLARTTAADLVVVGDRGRSAVERFFLGSTSARLIAAPPADVLVVRAAAR